MAGNVGFRNRSVSQSHFAMIPRSDIPRSRFVVEFTHKTAFDAGYLIPVYLEEVLPGDTFQVSMTAFARMATPLFPVMDNFHLDSFFFFVPNRIVYNLWTRQMGEQTSPGASTSFLTPQYSFTTAPAVGSLPDYFGIPTAGQVTTVPLRVNGLPFRGYFAIWNEWFRDQNLQTPFLYELTDALESGPGTLAPLRRGKRHDYFTSCLPWPQKGDAVTLPLGTTAPVIPGGAARPTFISDIPSSAAPLVTDAGGAVTVATGVGDLEWGATGLVADLATATGATINAIRQAFQIQRLLERDARGGTRYTELLLSHFGVTPQDARLQRPEYLGGGSSPVHINPVAQTSAGTAGNPLGALGATGTSVARHSFSGSFTEHGFIIGLVNVRADLTYQQGLHKMWSRRTRYDYYWPAFAHLGEQAVLRKEIYCTGNAVDDDTVFGYQERWSEYRYHPSMITGIFRSTAALNIDEWHAAQHFATPPVLGATFITDTPPVSRVLAAGVAANGQQFLFDSVFTVASTRAMPTYSVPGFIDRF